VPLERIGKTTSLMTVVGGRVVYAVRPFDAAAVPVASAR